MSGPTQGVHSRKGEGGGGKGLRKTINSRMYYITYAEILVFNYSHY